ncbi:MAG TPA: hypothetical protein PLA39_07005 [Methanoculleus sp.]|nr:hypothetical protein [Methanoculleus sp.]
MTNLDQPHRRTPMPEQPPEPPTDDEIQRLVATQPGMLGQAAGLLKKLLRKEISPNDAEFQITELKIQLDENIATMKKLYATKGDKIQDETH